MIKIENLTKTYKQGNNEINAVSNFSQTINDDEFVSIVGKSGSGKSTLLHLVGGLDKATSGSIFIDDTDITKSSENELNLLRREKIGFVFQNFNLIPELTAKENIIFPLLLLKKETDSAYFEQLMNLLDIENRLDHLPSELSGGQQQRIAIARAFIKKPKYVLCDEPTGNLDSETGAIVMKMIKELKMDLGQTVLLVTHDQDYASLADRIITIKDGKNEEV